MVTYPTANLPGNAMSALGYFHFLAALLALAGGAAVLLMSKGTARHVRAGRVYLFSMVFLNLSALGIYRITGALGAFHLMALLSLATLAFGVSMLRLKGRAHIHVHAYLMLWSFLGLVAAAVSEFATHILGWPASAGVIGTSLALFVVGGALVHTRGAATIQRVAADRSPVPGGPGSAG